MTLTAGPIVTVMAGRRDASWYSRPDTHRVKVWHVVVGNSPACNSTSALIAAFTTRDAATIPVESRCRRLGCQKRWPAMKQAVR